MPEPRRFHCISCRKRVAATSDDHYRKHDRAKGVECARSKRDIPTWLLRRGPETGPDDERPVIGRDYAPCPQCLASPVLDGATGCYVRHTREGDTPTSPRVPCAMSGEPCEAPEGEPCPATVTPESRASENGVDSASSSNSPSPSLNESEEMISQWAATAREIEDRELPPSFPESTTSQPDSPTRPGVPAPQPDATADPSGDATAATPSDACPAKLCHRTAEHGPHKWMHERRQAQCPGKPAPEGTARTESAPTIPSAEHAAPVSEAASSRENGSKNKLGVAAVARLSRKSAPTPDATPADSAAPAPAGAQDWKSLLAPVPRATPSDAATTPTASGRTEPAVAAPAEPLFAQPGSPFSQPGKPPAAGPAVPMSLEGERIAASLKQLFFDYCNRTERSRQKTLGPSGIGTPCDRKIAMTLLDIPAVNPGWIDKWASFVGTAIHAGLAEVFEWANAGTGRYATEMPLTFPSASVPRGTGDLLDRTYASFLDHKSLSAYGVKKFKQEGPPPHHRIQVQVYAYGARLKGEVVDHVVIIGWPREGNSLNDLCVWTERYDPQIARDALARVDRIAAEIETRRDALNRRHVQPLEVARLFPIDTEGCKFCDWYAPGDPGMTRGCNGRA